MSDMNDHFGDKEFTGYDEIDVAYIMRQIFSVLAYIHYEGYVHRDVKPENFVVTNDQLLPIKLASLATVVKREGTYGLKGVVGTYLYMAPEMLMEKSYDKGVDMWSAGIIMYMLLTGTHPLVAIREQEESADMYKTLIKRTLINDNTVVVDMSKSEVRLLKKEIRNLLNQLLELDPKKRITAERALKDPWIVKSGGIKRQKNILNIEKLIRKRQDLHDVLMNVISVICAPVLKVMLLDRMCNHCKYARHNGYPEVSKDLEKLYRMLFYLIDDDGTGFLSKNEILSCTLYY
eukprot:TRINITY_DN2202_c0_g3_i3.p1 TRINITY_DN2202_c0_g3~~TRINITY_DN2202_c0_g3_i3.p1  ORF type:complete len:290 (-),score=108.68 TRINITY_DN2202_c0_g3_i3:568-1437(-)